MDDLTPTLAEPQAEPTNFAALMHQFQQAIDPVAVQGLANQIGVSRESLMRLGIGKNRIAYTFPERDGDGQVVGITKRMPNGDKIAMKGGHRGLFLEWPLGKYQGLHPDDPILIVEGASDTAAAMDLGYTAIGRPSATGGVRYLGPLVRNRHCVVLGENDGGAGHLGAEKVANDLIDVAASVKVAYQPDGCKDLREWATASAPVTREELDRLIATTDPWVPTPESGQDANPAYVGKILNPADPMPSARQFVAQHYTRESMRTLQHQAGVFYGWSGTCYPPVDDGAIRARVWAFLEGAQQRSKGDDAELVPFQPTKSKTDNVIDALKALANLPTASAAPLWLSDDPDLPNPLELVACRNGLLHLPTMKLWPPNPLFFSPNALDYEYQADAPEPDHFHTFLNQLWPDDPASIRTLQRWFGYCLTPDTKHQKALMPIGPKRSGKGTIGRVMAATVGLHNVCGPSLASLATPFGLSPLLGKTLAIIGDARLSGRADQAAIVERLLNITGEDLCTIDRKHLPSVTCKLPTRIVLLCNELPRLGDASGALPSRFIVLRLERSFFGQEDTGLTDRLLTELPGILKWSIEGWHDLLERGQFDQPETAADALAEMADLSSPIGAFIRESCQIAAGYQVEVATLYAAWREWCGEQGRDKPGTKQTFGRDLRAALPQLKMAQPRDEDGKQNRVYEGIMPL